MNLTGKTITTEENKQYVLSDIIGQGAQGVIYAEPSGKYLIKIYNTKQGYPAEIQLGKIKNLAKSIFPPRFIKPVDIISVRDDKKCLIIVGYVMARVYGHISLNKLLMPSKEFSLGNWYNEFSGGLHRRLYLAYQISMNFYLLHRNGKAYCDISGSNILVAEKKNTMSVCMIDIDNIYIPGRTESSVLGTSRYMAPEILNNQIQPDMITDDYSLAVIIFELLRNAHPYIGDFVENGSPELEAAAYRGMTAYIDDESDDSNRSTSALPNNVVFNESLKKLFSKTFIDGKNNRMTRATAKEFAVACLEASNALILCKKCGAWYFPFPSIKTHQKNYICPWCESENKLPSYLIIKERFPKFEGGFFKDSKGIDFSQRTLKTFFLRENEINRMTNNYIKQSMSFEDIANESVKEKFVSESNFKNAFVLGFDKHKHCKICNTSDDVIYVRKKNKGEYIRVVPQEKIFIEDRDCIYFEVGSTCKIEDRDCINFEDGSTCKRDFNYDKILNDCEAKNIRTRRFIELHLNDDGGNIA